MRNRFMSQSQRQCYSLEVEKTQDNCLIYCDAKVTRAWFKLVHEVVDQVQYTRPYNLFETVL